MPVTANSIITPQTPLTGTAVATTANTTYTDTPTNTVQLLAGQTNGARVTKITALARATNSATELQLYASTDGGTTKRFIKSVLLASYSVSTSTAQTGGDFLYTENSPLVLAANESLWVGISVSNTGIVFRAEGFAY
jgi:hypothetical protein